MLHPLPGHKSGVCIQGLKQSVQYFPGVQLNEVQFTRSIFCNTDLYLHRRIKISCTVAKLNFHIKLACLTCVFCLPLNQKQIPQDVADIFNAPSDKDLIGFQDDASKQRLLSEDSYACFDHLESEQKVGMYCRGPVTLFRCSITLSLCQGFMSRISQKTP